MNIFFWGAAGCGIALVVTTIIAILRSRKVPTAATPTATKNPTIVPATPATTPLAPIPVTTTPAPAKVCAELASTEWFLTCFPEKDEIENGRPINPTAAALTQYWTKGAFPLAIYVYLEDYDGMEVFVPAIAQLDGNGNISIIALDGDRKSRDRMGKLAVDYIKRNPDPMIWGKLGIILLGPTIKPTILT